MKSNAVSLATLALLLAFAPACAMAQSSVTVYGVMDLNVNVDQGSKAAGRLIQLSSGQTGQSGSRIGFRGVEDLGGGLSALFVLEAGVLPDTGLSDQGGVLFGRTAIVGVQGSAGTVRLGRMATPSWTVQTKVDPFAIGLAGDMSRLFGTTGKRTDNTINYTSPSANGLTAELAYAAGEQAGDAAKARQVGGSLTYEHGPLLLAASHHIANSNPSGLLAIVKTKTSLIGAVYDFGPAALHFAYDVNKNGLALDTRDLLVGVSIPVGQGKIMADVIRKSDKVLADADARMAAIAYIHKLSARTSVYTSYSHLSNGSKAKYQVELAGRSDTFYNVGMRHAF
jgi:predicted porin